MCLVLCQTQLGMFREVQQRFKSNLELVETYRELCVSLQELISTCTGVFSGSIPWVL